MCWLVCTYAVPIQQCRDEAKTISVMIFYPPPPPVCFRHYCLFGCIDPALNSRYVITLKMLALLGCLIRKVSEHQNGWKISSHLIWCKLALVTVQDSIYHIEHINGYTYCFDISDNFQSVSNTRQLSLYKEYRRQSKH